MDGVTEVRHATCIAVEDRAALIFGPSGAGKSDLALRAVSTRVWDGTRGLVARLVSDDQVVLELRHGQLLASPPAAIAGRIEVRGLGILTLDYLTDCRVCLVVELDSRGEIERLPSTDDHVELLGSRVLRIRLRPFEASAAIKLVLALSRSKDNQ